MNDIKWNKVILEEFMNLACLTETEEKVLKFKIAGIPIEQQADILCMSRSNVNVIIRRIRNKYDSAQPFSNILPPRIQGTMEEKSK